MYISMIGANYCSTLVCTPEEQRLVEHDIMIQNQEKELRLIEGNNVPVVGVRNSQKMERGEYVDLTGKYCFFCFFYSNEKHT
jgi:hypothetical protein